MTPNQSTPTDLPDDVVLSVRGVSKKFCRNLRRSMWYGIQDLSQNLIGRGTGAEVRSQMSEVGSQKSEVRSPTSDLRPLSSALRPPSSPPCGRTNSGRSKTSISNYGAGNASDSAAFARLRRASSPASFRPTTGKLRSGVGVGALIALGAGGARSGEAFGLDFRCCQLTIKKKQIEVV
jgi:hypothetical protein